MRKFIHYIKHTFQHKISFWKLKNLKKKLIEYGPTFLIIMIIVELLEHIGLPILFYYLGVNVHDFFYVFIPAPVFFCLHFITAPLVFFLYIYIKKLKNKKLKISNFYKNTLKLLTSISIAQIIPIIIIIPILTQYFSPEDFGVYGLYLSICTILGVVASGKYDVAIMLPKQKIDSINILALCFLMSFLVSVFCFSILNIFNTKLFELTNSIIFKNYYIIIPISIFLIAINQSIITWFNRNRSYNTIASQNIIKSSSNSFTSLLLGLQHINSGLIFGHITSMIITSIWNIQHLLKNFTVDLISVKIMRKNFIKYIDFLKFSTVSNLFNSFANIGMTTVVIIFFGPKIAGLYFLAEKLVAIPTSLITSSISQVYFQKASRLFHSNKIELLQITNSIQKNVFYLLFPFLLICTIWGENFFSIFGNEWKQAGIILKYFTVFILLKNIYSPVSHIGDILNKQKVLLIFNISLFTCQLASFYFLKEYNDIKPALLTASLIGAIHYLLLDIYMKRQLSKLL